MTVFVESVKKMRLFNPFKYWFCKHDYEPMSVDGKVFVNAYGYVMCQCKKCGFMIVVDSKG